MNKLVLAFLFTLGLSACVSSEPSEPVVRPTAVYVSPRYTLTPVVIEDRTLIREYTTY